MYRIWNMETDIDSIDFLCGGAWSGIKGPILPTFSKSTFRKQDKHIYIAQLDNRTHLECLYLILNPRKIHVRTMPTEDSTVIVRNRLNEITLGTTTSIILSGGGCPPVMTKMSCSSRGTTWKTQALMETSTPWISILI